MTADERIATLLERVRQKSGTNPRQAAEDSTRLARYRHSEIQWHKEHRENEVQKKARAHPAFGWGSISADVANGHDMRTARDMHHNTWLWCKRCGAFTKERIRALAVKCRGQCNSSRKRRLEDRRNPYTGRNHGGIDPANMTWADIDAVAIFDECIRMQEQHSEECSIGNWDLLPDVGEAGG